MKTKQIGTMVMREDQFKIFEELHKNVLSDLEDDENTPDMSEDSIEESVSSSHLEVDGEGYIAKLRISGGMHVVLFYTPSYQVPSGLIKLKDLTVGDGIDYGDDPSSFEKGIVIPSDAIELKRLDCSNNGLYDSGLKIPEELVNLETILCVNSQLRHLDVSELFTKLRYLDCSNNLLGSLSLSGTWKNMEELHCSKNDLASLVIPYGLDSLRVIDCSRNKLLSFNIKGSHPALKEINCSYNDLTGFSEQIDSLEKLSLYRNKLSTSALEDVAKSCPNLRSLNLGANGLSEVSIPSNLRNLEVLYLQLNDLRELHIPESIGALTIDVSGNDGLEKVYLPESSKVVIKNCPRKETPIVYY